MAPVSSEIIAEGSKEEGGYEQGGAGVMGDWDVGDMM